MSVHLTSVKSTETSETYHTHHINLHTVDFTSDGTPMGVAAGNLWLVRLATFILQPIEHTNDKFPAATATGVPSEVKSTVLNFTLCYVL